jgi:ABC-2 type transport system permease protein
VTAPVATGAVYDRGYRPYDGPRGGRRTATFALYKASIRRALGIRRSWRQKVAPFVLLAVVTVPAVVNVGIAYITRDRIGQDTIQIINYRDYVGVSSALLVFVALTAPDIVCPDRRQRVLPVLFARPLKGVDYVVAKVGALFTILFLFSFLPQVLLYVGQTLVSPGSLSYVEDHLDVLWQVPLAVAVMALFHAVIGVALASLSSRRIVAGASIIGLFLVTSITANILLGPPDERTGESYAGLLNLVQVPLFLRDVIFEGHLDQGGSLTGADGGALLALLVYVAVVLAGMGVLLYRYRWTER